MQLRQEHDLALSAQDLKTAKFQTDLAKLSEKHDFSRSRNNAREKGWNGLLNQRNAAMATVTESEKAFEARMEQRMSNFIEVNEKRLEALAEDNAKLKSENAEAQKHIAYLEDELVKSQQKAEKALADLETEKTETAKLSADKEKQLAQIAEQEQAGYTRIQKYNKLLAAEKDAQKLIKSNNEKFKKKVDWYDSEIKRLSDESKSLHENLQIHRNNLHKADTALQQWYAVKYKVDDYDNVVAAKQQAETELEEVKQILESKNEEIDVLKNKPAPANDPDRDSDSSDDEGDHPNGGDKNGVNGKLTNGDNFPDLCGASPKRKKKTKNLADELSGLEDDSDAESYGEPVIDGQNGVKKQIVLEYSEICSEQVEPVSASEEVFTTQAPSATNNVDDDASVATPQILTYSEIGAISELTPISPSLPELTISGNLSTIKSSPISSPEVNNDVPEFSISSVISETLSPISQPLSEAELMVQESVPGLGFQFGAQITNQPSGQELVYDVPHSMVGTRPYEDDVLPTLKHNQELVMEVMGTRQSIEPVQYTLEYLDFEPSPLKKRITFDDSKDDNEIDMEPLIIRPPPQIIHKTVTLIEYVVQPLYQDPFTWLLQVHWQFCLMLALFFELNQDLHISTKKDLTISQTYEITEEVEVPKDGPAGDIMSARADGRSGSNHVFSTAFTPTQEAAIKKSRSVKIHHGTVNPPPTQHQYICRNWWKIITYLLIVWGVIWYCTDIIQQRALWFHANENTQSILSDVFKYRRNVNVPGEFTLSAWLPQNLIDAVHLLIVGYGERGGFDMRGYSIPG